jgi:hypothetical protein
LFQHVFEFFRSHRINIVNNCSWVNVGAKAPCRGKPRKQR